MWRNLSPREQESVKTGRNPLSKAVSILGYLLLVLPVGFGIDNLITLILNKSAASAAKLVLDIVLAVGLIILMRKLKKLLNSDVENGELVACEAEIVNLTAENIEAVTITSNRKETSIAYFAFVHPVDDPESIYKVKTGVEFQSMHKTGDRVLLVCSKDEIKEEFMMLLEVAK